MEANKRRSQTRRKPLSDCTNTIITTRSSSASKSLLKPSKFLPSSTFKNPENQSKINTESDTSVGSNTAATTTTSINNTNALPNPSSIPSPPSTPLRLSNPSSTDSGDPMIDYSRRRAAHKRKEKGKMIADPLSCPPPERSTNFWDEPRGFGDVGLSKSCRVPRKKKQRQLPPEKDEHSLPQDYIEQQKAYFAEIDAFELPVEFVSKSELE